MTNEVKEVYEEYYKQIKEYFEYNKIELTEQCKKELEQCEKIIMES